MKEKTQKGITLIALIVTIVVTLILVAVSANVITKSDLTGRAKRAADSYNTAMERDEEGGKVEVEGIEYESLADYSQVQNLKINIKRFKENIITVESITGIGEKKTQAEYEEECLRKIESMTAKEKEELYYEMNPNGNYEGFCDKFALDLNSQLAAIVVESGYNLIGVWTPPLRDDVLEGIPSVKESSANSGELVLTSSFEIIDEIPDKIEAEIEPEPLEETKGTLIPIKIYDPAGNECDMGEWYYATKTGKYTYTVKNLNTNTTYKKTIAVSLIEATIEKFKLKINDGEIQEHSYLVGATWEEYITNPLGTNVPMASECGEDQLSLAYSVRTEAGDIDYEKMCSSLGAIDRLFRAYW